MKMRDLTRSLKLVRVKLRAHSCRIAHGVFIATVANDEKILIDFDWKTLSEIRGAIFVGILKHFLKK